MFLLMGMFVWTAIAEETPQESSAQANDLQLKIMVETSFSVPHGMHPQIINIGTDPVEGPITVTLTVEKGLFIKRPFEQHELVLLNEGETLEPGEIVHMNSWYPNPHYRGLGIYTFKYEMDYDDENLENNVDSVRFLIFFLRMFGSID